MARRRYWARHSPAYVELGEACRVPVAPEAAVSAIVEVFPDRVVIRRRHAGAPTHM